MARKCNNILHFNRTDVKKEGTFNQDRRVNVLCHLHLGFDNNFL